MSLIGGTPVNGTNPLMAFLRTQGYLLTGRLHFPRSRVGEKVKMSDGREFTIFREGRVDARPGQPREPGATFIVRFHVAGMSPRRNKLFSLLPMPFCMGFPGFWSKLWTIDEKTGGFQGIYQWNTVQNAEDYAHSVALTFMTRRSLPGSMSYEIVPNDVSSSPSGQRAWRRTSPS